MRLTLAACVLAACTAGWGVTPCAAEVVDRVLAVVSGTVITLSDARTALAFGAVTPGTAADPVAVALNWLIDRQLVLDEALRYDAGDVDDAAVAGVLARIRSRYPSDDAYATAIAHLGLDQSGARAWVRDTIRAEQYVAHRVDSLFQVTDDELREYFTRHQAQFSRGATAPAFDQVRDEVREALRLERRRQTIETWLARLRRRADVNEIYLPVREPHEMEGAHQPSTMN